MRGYMTSHGQPDEPRSARYILKDYVNVSSAGCVEELAANGVPVGQVVLLPPSTRGGWQAVQSPALPSNTLTGCYREGAAGGK